MISIKLFSLSLERKLLHAQSQVTNHTEKRMATEKVLSTIANEAAREAIGQSRRQSSSGSNSPSLSMFNSTSTQSISYSLGKFISSDMCYISIILICIPQWHSMGKQILMIYSIRLHSSLRKWVQTLGVFQIKPVMVLSNINCTFAFKFKNWKWVKMLEFYFVFRSYGSG